MVRKRASSATAVAPTTDSIFLPTSASNDLTISSVVGSHGTSDATVTLRALTTCTEGGNAATERVAEVAAEPALSLLPRALACGTESFLPSPATSITTSDSSRKSVPLLSSRGCCSPNGVTRAASWS